MKDEQVKTPPKGPRGPGMGGNPGEKAKNFKSAITRLFQELKTYHIVVALALILAALSSILSIFSPNKLSELTDKISEGLVINTKNLETITETITTNLSQSNINEILSLDLSPTTINSIMSSQNITDEDKQLFNNFITNIENINQEQILQSLQTLPDNILTILLKESTYKDIKISSQDKISFIKYLSILSNKETTNIEFPTSIGKILLTDIKIDKTTINVEEQIEFLSILSNIKNTTNTKEIYSQIDKMPESIQEVVSPIMDINIIKSIAIFLVIIYILSAIFNYLESILMTIVSNKFANNLRRNISTKINKLPLQYFDKHPIGDTLSRVTNDVDTIAQSMNQSLSTLVSAITLFIGTIIMMFITNWIMALTAIISSLFGFIFMFTVLSKSQQYFISRQVELGNLNGHIEEVYSGLNVVKVYNGKKISDKKFDEYNQKVYIANKKSQFLSGLMHPMMGFIGNFGYVAVCIVGALLTMNDIISFGVIVAFITYVRLFTSPLTQIAQAMTSLQTTAAASERVFEFLDETEMSNQTNITTTLEKDKVKGKIEFNNIVFQYAGNDTPTIKNFSAKALPGQKIAIVGPTGAGKTTMVNLLMKFYDITSGDIKIDGISTKNLTRENVHDLFTMVLQDTWLFNGTIKENIIYNRENISEEQIEEVCKTVGLDHFIKTLPKGYDTEISDNDSVSAGQRQLLTIARGMIDSSPFLILDEATSNVDTRTEELVQQAMDKLTEGKTSFIIAHRLSTIKNADLILVMKDGNIIETGSHNELMKQKGFYAELYNSQFEL